MYSTFGFKAILYNRTGGAEELPVLLSTPPQLECDTEADIKISLDIEVEHKGKLNYSYDTIGLLVRFDGREHRAGRYVIVAGTKDEDRYNLTCFDLCQMARRTKLETRKYFAKGTLYTYVISVFLQEAGILNYVVEENGFTLQTAREDWEPGQDYLTIINGLLDEMGYQSLYMDLDGIVRSGPKKTASVQNVTKTYSAHDVKNILLPGAQVEIDAFDRPNVFYYSCENPDLPEPLYALAVNDNPKDPFSTLNAPRNPVFRSVDNIASLDALQEKANKEMSESQISRDIVRFETALALHNPFEVLAVTKKEFDGIVQETAWTMPLEAGGVMQHTGKQAAVRWIY